MRFFILTLLFASQASFAANQIVTKDWFTLDMCKDGLLQQYVKASNELRELQKSGADSEKIAHSKAALEIIVDGLDPNEFGGTVIVKPDAVKSAYEVPSLAFDGLDFELATVVVNPPVVKIEFRKLGICSFADPSTMQVNDREIQNAVDSVLGK